VQSHLLLLFDGVSEWTTPPNWPQQYISLREAALSIHFSLGSIFSNGLRSQIVDPKDLAGGELVDGMTWPQFPRPKKCSFLLKNSCALSGGEVGYHLI